MYKKLKLRFLRAISMLENGERIRKSYVKTARYKKMMLLTPKLAIKFLE